MVQDAPSAMTAAPAVPTISSSAYGQTWRVLPSAICCAISRRRTKYNAIAQASRRRSTQRFAVLDRDRRQHQPAVGKKDAVDRFPAPARRRKALHQHVPEQQLQQQRNVAQHFDIDRRQPRQQPVRRQPRNADQRAEHGRKHDADHRDPQRVDDADEEGARDRCPSGCRGASCRRSACPPRGRETQSRSRCGGPRDCAACSTTASRRRRRRSPPPRSARTSPLRRCLSFSEMRHRARTRGDRAVDIVTA